MGIYGDLFSHGSFIINPCFDLWGFMDKINKQNKKETNKQTKTLDEF